MSISIRNSCRICQEPHLQRIINLGDQFIQHAFIKEGKESITQKKFPTQLVKCVNPDCGLVQLRHTIPPEILYSVYWYRSGTNNTMKKHLQGIAQEATQIFNENKAAVLDIGSNDGTMLHFFPDTFTKTGIDPSDIAYELKNGVEVIHDFFPSKKLKNRNFDIITSIAMFYDVDDPVAFAKEVKRIMTNDGLWILEVAYLPIMLENVSYDTICHEHLCYFDLYTLEQIFARAGLKVVKADLNNINGGSIRCYVTHTKSIKYDKLQSELLTLRNKERNFIAQKDEILQQFVDKVQDHKLKLIKLIKKLRKEKATIHLYGASTKGNTILQFCKISVKDIPYAADKNPEKWGGKTPGSNIEIISEEQSRTLRPDYYLVMPWSFKKEFIVRERDSIIKGTKMIFPLPEIEIIDKRYYER